MISKIYDELLSKREEIIRGLSSTSKDIIDTVEKTLKEVWIPTKPSLTNKKLISIDGGMWSQETRSGVVFAINAEAVLSEGLNISIVDGKAYVGVFKPGNYAKERISLLMQLFELQLAIKYGNKADFILLDGSISKKIGRRKFDDKIADLDDLFSEDKVMSLEEKEEEKMHEYLIAENQIAIARLVESFPSKLVFISKKSKSTDLFNEDYSDMTILELFTKDVGYTKPKAKLINPKYLASKKASEILGEKSYYYSFIRLEPNEKVLRVDYLNPEYITDIFNSLTTVSVKGYPFPLLVVHKDVRASKEDIERIRNTLGLKKKDIDWWPSQFY
ncbi:MAG: DNA double-strand break repair nuclease NurA [Sulfolobus sp.]